VPTIRERTKKQNGKTVTVFHVQVRMSGFPARTASFPTRRQAERWAKTVEAEMIEGKHFRSVEARRRTLGEAIDRYCTEELGLPAGADQKASAAFLRAEAAAGRKPKKKDTRTRVTRLRWWKEKLGHLKLAEVTAAVLVEYRGKLGRETFTRADPNSKRTTLKEGEAAQEFKHDPATVNRYLAYLSHVFTIARKEWHWISHDPFDGVSRHKEGKGRVRYLTDDERTRLLKETAKDPQLHTVVVLALSTAARAGEITNLRWSDIELKDGRVLLRETKNTQPRTAWIHGEALKLLKEHGKVRRLDDDRVFVSAKGKQYRYHEPFVAACEAAKVADFTFHGLRHSAATYLAREGATEQQLKAIGGWKSNVVSRYVHLAAQDAKDVVEKMNNKILGPQE
jgi:integrase